MRRRSPLLLLLAVPWLIAADTATPSAAELDAQIQTMALSVERDLAALEAALPSLDASVKRAVERDGDRDSALLLSRDAERIARSAAALQFKAQRLRELAAALPGPAPAEAGALARE